MEEQLQLRTREEEKIALKLDEASYYRAGQAVKPEDQLNAPQESRNQGSQGTLIIRDPPLERRAQA